MIEHKRIAKNTFLLYIRQLISIIISLYTTRLVLQLLGVTDFGLYNVVGGIVPLFTFVTTAMTSASQRFIAVDLGKNDVEHLKQTFSTLSYIYLVLAFLIFIAAETIGLWYLNNRMVIPTERLCIANIVYQLSILSCIISTISTPYNATIVAHERLDVYAYIGILEVTLRLLLVVLMQFFLNADYLLIYAIGLCTISINSRIIYQTFCKKHFIECVISNRCFNYHLLKDMTTYTIFNMIGSVAIVAKNQGANLLMNLFFGTIANAAQGIAMQVVNAVNSFVSNLYMSTRPQIIKQYSADNWTESWEILKFSTKFSFFLILIIMVPVLLGMDSILNIWLNKHIEYTTTFIKLILLDVLIQSVTNQLIAVLQAANKIKSYQLSSSIILLLNLPITYILYKIGLPPYYLYVVSIILSLIASVLIVYMTKKEIAEFKIIVFIHDILLPLVNIVIPIAFSIGIMTCFTNNTFARCAIGLLLACVNIYFLGMNKSERKKAIQFIHK